MDYVTYALCKKLIANSMAGEGVIKGEPGKSAFELAQEAGYTGTQEEWITSLKGEPGYTPYIGENGNWFVNEIDTGVSASNDAISSETINALFAETKGGN